MRGPPRRPPPLLLAVLAVVLAVSLAVPGAGAARVAAGSCPLSVALRQCTPTCRAHDDCPGATLCCATVCGGTACVRAVTDVRRALGDAGRDPDCCPKRGRCPAVEEGEWLCNSRCRGDFDCEGPDKCCPTRCGAMDCTPPL